MKLAHMGGGQPAGVVEVADPLIADNYVLVKVHAAPLCTEFKYKDKPNRGGFGHEAAGEVVAAGLGVRRVQVGERVAVMPQNGCGVCALCRTGEHIYCQAQRHPLQICGCSHGRDTLTQFVIQQDWLLLPFPASVSYDHASMACCGMGPGFNAMQAMEVAAGDTVLISGLGPVGLGAAIVALFRGARVWGLEINEYRRALARRLGVEQVFNPQDADIREQILTASDGHGVPKSVDTTRQETSARLLIEVAQRRGQVAFIGQGGTIGVAPLVGKGLRVHGCWHWNHLRDAERMLATIQGSADRIDTLITHTFPMERIAEALDLQVSGQCGKVIIRPWE